MDKKRKMVSIIVPVFNVEKYIVKCIESIINQTYTNLEIILVDDGSTDCSGFLCDKFSLKDKRIVVIHKNNGGLSDARNRGLDVARGEYITFIDGDDYYEQGTISRLVGEFDGTVGICCMGINVVAEDFTIRSKDIEKECYDDSASFITKICRKQAGSSVCSKLFKKDLVVSQRFLKGRFNEDFHFVVSILLHNDLVVKTVNYNGYYYVSRRGSITNSARKISILDAIDNCNDLYREAERINNNDVLASLAEMALHQSCVALIINPDHKLGKKSLFYTKAINAINKYRKYIHFSTLRKRDKIICRLVLLFPKITCFVVNSIYRNRLEQ